MSDTKRSSPSFRFSAWLCAFLVCFFNIASLLLSAEPDMFEDGVIELEGTLTLSTSVEYDQKYEDDDASHGIRKGDIRDSSRQKAEISSPVFFTCGARRIKETMDVMRSEMASLGFTIPRNPDLPEGSQIFCGNNDGDGNLTRLSIRLSEEHKTLVNRCECGEGKTCRDDREWAVRLEKAFDSVVSGILTVKFTGKDQAYRLEVEPVPLGPDSVSIVEKDPSSGKPVSRPGTLLIHTLSFLKPSCCPSLKKAELLVPMPEFEEYLDNPDHSRTFTSTAVSTCSTERHCYKHTVKASLTLGKRKEPAVAAEMIPPDTYESWLPEARLSEEESGNHLRILARVHPPGDPDEKSDEKARFLFTLADVSGYPGTSGNTPLKEANTSPDLTILEELNPDLEIKPDGQHASTKERKNEAEIVITSRDWAARGNLLVTAVLDDGTEVSARCRGFGNDVTLQIPRDENENMIGDAWEKEHNIFSLSLEPGQDEDRYPENQKSTGDGHSLFEEYRGYRVLVDEEGSSRPLHTRTNPNHKDLFVFDRDGIIKEYYQPHNPAKLILRYVDETLMRVGNPTIDRQINFNTPGDSGFRYAPQYAMRVIDGPKPADGVSEVRSVHDTLSWDEAFEQPLKYIHEVLVSRPGVREEILSAIARLGKKKRSDVDPAKLDQYRGIFNKMMIMNTCHEIGHGMGIHHHRPGKKPPEDESAREGWMRSGSQTCPIRYIWLAEYDLMLQPNGDDLFPLMTEYCGAYPSGRQITGLMKEGMFNQDNENQPAPCTTAFNCWSQINIKSDP